VEALRHPAREVDGPAAESFIPPERKSKKKRRLAAALFQADSGSF